MKNTFVLVIISLLLISCGQKASELGFNLEKGKTYNQVTSSKSTITQNISNEEVKMILTVDGDISYLVKSVEGDSYKLEAVYNNLAMIMEMKQGTFDFSSEKHDDSDYVSTILGAMINKPFEVIISKSGKVKEVNNISRLWDSAIDELSDLNTNQKKQINKQIVKAYGLKSFKGNFEISTGIYPENTVAKGDTWKIETLLESGLSAKLSTNYTYKDLVDGKAIIEGQSIISSTEKDVYVESNGMQVKYDIEGTMQSEIKVDPKSGWILEANIIQDMSGTTTIKESPELPEGMTIPIQLSNEIIVSSN